MTGSTGANDDPIAKGLEKTIRLALDGGSFAEFRDLKAYLGDVFGTKFVQEHSERIADISFKYYRSWPSQETLSEQDPLSSDPSDDPLGSPIHLESYPTQGTTTTSREGTRDRAGQSGLETRRLLPKSPTREYTHAYPHQDKLYHMDGAGAHSYSPELIRRYRNLVTIWPKLKNHKGTAKIAVLLDEIECAVHIDVVVTSGVNDQWIPIPPRIIPLSLGPSGNRKFIREQGKLLTNSFTITDIPSKWPCGHFNLSSEALDSDLGIPKSLTLKESLGKNKPARTYVVAVSHQGLGAYALKRIQRKRDNFQAAQEQMRYFKGELKAMKYLRLRHCVRLVGSYTEANHVGILMHPVADANLAQYLDEFHYEGRNGNPSTLASFFGCLAMTMQSLHYEYNIRHKDIKPQNILVKDNTVLFTDFGIALDWTDSGKTTTKEETMRSPRYCAPEAAQDLERNTKTDIWSLGCVFLEMATVLKGKNRDFVSQNMRPNDIFHQNPRGVAAVISELKKDQSKCGNAPLEWIEKMLQHEKQRRPNSRELVEMIEAAEPDGSLVFSGPCCQNYGCDSDYISEDGESVLESIASTSMAPSTLPTEVSLHPVRRDGTRLLTDFLFHHAELKPLYESASGKVSTQKLRKHLRHFFRCYGKDLAKEATNNRERLVASFVESCAGHVAGKIASSSMNDSGIADQRPGDSVLNNREKVDSMDKVNKWFNSEWPEGVGPVPSSQPEKPLPLTPADSDDSDDSEDPDLPPIESTPSLDIAKDFMESTQAFQVLRSSLRLWVKMDTPTKDESLVYQLGEQDDLVPRVKTQPPITARNTYSEDEAPNEQTDEQVLRVPDPQKTPVVSNKPSAMSIPRTLPECVHAFLQMALPFRPEPRIPLGKARIRWRCSCGQMLFDDFFELKPGGLQALQSRLQYQDTTGSDGGHTTSTVKRFTEPLRACFCELAKWASAAIFRTSRYRNRDNAIDELPSYQGNATTGPEARNRKYLLMCIDKGQTFTGLYQPPLSDIDDDKQLCLFLRDEYYKHRKTPSWFTMRDVKSLSLCRFTADINNFAGVHPHRQCPESRCFCLPPFQRVESKEYQCSPAPEFPADVEPPISPRALTHYFKSPNHPCNIMRKRDILEQLPKRSQQLLPSHDRSEVGWGVHFEECWHWPTICVVIGVFFVIGGLAFGIAWSITKGDVSSAFAVAATWVAIAPILFGLILASDSSQG